MKTLTIVILSLFSLCALAGPRSTPPPAAPKPKTPEQVTSDFFTYLLAPKRDIASDNDAQARWLSASVRQQLAEATAAAKKAAETRPNDKIDFPCNGTFLAAWDSPTSFAVTTSQRTPFLALVAIRCHWGPRTDYPGDKRTMTIVVTFENDAWRISDIHTHAGKFIDDHSLLQSFQHMKTQ